jgi:hypothetical protein
VEEQIKRRVAIGSFVSERKLVDELVRWAHRLFRVPVTCECVVSCVSVAHAGGQASQVRRGCMSTEAV